MATGHLLEKVGADLQHWLSHSKPMIDTSPLPQQNQRLACNPYIVFPYPNTQEIQHHKHLQR